MHNHAGVEFDDDIVPMDNKRNLIQSSGAVTATLFDSGFDRVVVLRDEKKAARPIAGERLCWHNDRQDILASLQRARVVNRPVHLVFIEREFDSWLLFDHSMLSSVLSTPADPGSRRPSAKSGQPRRIPRAR